jgi:hypothetical protein
MESSFKTCRKRIVADRTLRRRMRMAKWRAKTAGMSYGDRQAYIKLQQEKCEAKILEATRPQREAEEQRIKKIKVWTASKEVIESIYSKPQKILASDRKKVERLLEVNFPVTDRAGKSKEKAVTQIAGLKFIPKQVRLLTHAEQRK